MGRRRAYLVDRARIRRPVIEENRRVVSSRNSAPEPHGDWVHARIRPPSGSEVRKDAMVKLAHTHEIVLYHVDLSGNDVCPIESDRLELRATRDQELGDTVVQNFKIAGTIVETRKRSKITGYVIPVVLETEY